MRYAADGYISVGWSFIHPETYERLRQADVYIGCGVVIDEGVTIGKGTRIFHNTVVRKGSTLGERVTLGHLVLIEADTVVGDDSTIQSQCHITAKASIGFKVFFGPSVTCINERKIASHGRQIPQMLEGPKIGNCSRVGANSLILPGRMIGDNCLLGAGSVLTRDMPDGEIWFGSPASFRMKVPVAERI